MESSKKTKEPTSVLGEMANQCVADSERWFGDGAVVHSIPHHTLAMAGEVGEFANIVKKIERGSLSIHDAKTRYALTMELTDTFIYMLNLAGLLGIDLEKSYKHIRGLNEKRFMEERDMREREARAQANGQ